MYAGAGTALAGMSGAVPMAASVPVGGVQAPPPPLRPDNLPPPPYVKPQPQPVMEGRAEGGVSDGSVP